MFLNCLDYILAPSLHLGHIKHMEDLITEFMSTYKELNNTIHIKPKGHFLIHYASQYKMFGPLINYSTLRFEGKHSNLKKIFSTNKNYKNPCLSIAKRHQYLQSLHNMDKDYFLENDAQFCKISRSITIDSLCSNLQDEINNVCPSDIESILCYKSVENTGITYEIGGVVLYDMRGGIYLFGQIKFITFLSGDAYLILNACDITEFNNHIHSYVLNVTNNPVLIKLSDLYSPFNLPSYNNTEKYLIVRLHHFVHQNYLSETNAV